jgi:hypothetical protein
MEPRYVAEIEWFRENNPFAWVDEIATRREWAEYFRGENPSLGERTVSITLPSPKPDWDWWEPRYDSPGRRLAFREAEFKRTGKAKR